MYDFFSKLRSLLTKKNKQFLLILLFLTIILSTIETIGISAIMPFISMVANPAILENGYYKLFYDFFSFETTTDFIIAFGFALILFYIFRGAYNLFYTYMLSRFSYGSYHQFAFRLFDGYLNMPYKSFVQKNSSTLTKTIVNEASNLSSLVQQTLLLLSEIFTVIFLYVILLFVNWKMTLVLTLVLVLKILLLTKTISKVVKKQGEKRNELQINFYKIISEAFGNFKLVKLRGNEEKTLSEFGIASSGYSKTNIISNTLSQAPRNILEMIGFSMLIASVIYILVQHKDASFVIPIISMYALALYRMLPAVNRMLFSYNQILFLHKSLDVVHADISYPIEDEGNEKISFDRTIKMVNVDFSYDEKTKVLQDINLTINKGDKLAFVGESGGGKSTLVDIIIGIYRPQSGNIYIDDKLLCENNIKSWRQKIGYIPQSIYLSDSTVSDNVVFGRSYDEGKIIDVLKKANIWDFLKTKDGLLTKVGEGGIQLSGGQKQRIGIARALYGNPDVLVLDEATSALDNETEAKIMDEVYDASTDKTLIVIAHRLSTVERCNKIYHLEQGRLI